MRFVALLLAAPLLLPAQNDQPAGTRSVLDVEQEQKQVQQAEELLGKGDAAKAKELLQTVLKDRPKNARADYDLGFAEQMLQHRAEAQAAFRAGIAADPQQFESRMALGMSLLEDGDTAHRAEARTQLLAAVERHPANGDESLKADAYRALAKVDAGTNNDAARDELLAALKISPETEEDRVLAAQIANATGDAGDAETQYRKILQSVPNDPTASVGLARLLRKKSNAVEAGSILEAAHGAHPQDLAITAELAGLDAANHKPAEAEALLEEAHKAAPDETAVSRMLTRLYVQSGEPEKSSPLYTELLAKSPNDAMLQNDWAESLLMQKRTPEAEEAFKRALSDPNAFPTREDYAQTAGRLAFTASANKDAVETLRALAIRDAILPPSAPSLFLAATAHDRLHHAKEAVALYRQFLQAAGGRFPNEEFEARHRIPALTNGR